MSNLLTVSLKKEHIEWIKNKQKDKDFKISRFIQKVIDKEINKEK